MTPVAILHPSDLLAEELKHEVETRHLLSGDLSLWTTHEDEVGQLTQARGAATVIQRYEPGDFEGKALVFFCGPIAENRSLLAELPADTTAVVLSPDAEPADGVPVVSGVNLDVVSPGGVYLSPNSGALLLTQLLAPLRGLGLQKVVATVIEPASVHGKAALEELFEQTKALLAFSSDKPREIFGRQLAFNLYPTGKSAAGWSQLVRDALGVEAPSVTAKRLQGGVFHGVSASLYLSFAAPVEPEAVRAALGTNAKIDFAVDEEPSPIEAASRTEILLGSLETVSDDPHGLWLWATMDNLTVGGAQNAADIAEAVLAARAGLPVS